MKGAKPNLDRIGVASPCSVPWDAMEGDDARARFCGVCKLNVYNLSAMTRDEAERLVAEREGRLCVRFYRRTDGTLLTRDCPVGLARLRRRAAAVAGAVLAAGLAILSGAFAFAGERRLGSADLHRIEPIATLLRFFEGPAPANAVMGDICIPPPPANRGN